MDAAANHPLTFLIMLVVMLPVCLTRVAKQTRIPAAKWKSFVNFWMIAYLVVQVALMGLTTATALFLLYDSHGGPKLPELPIPFSFLPLAAALLGVFGFEILLSKFIVGFGETKLDFSTTLQDLLDQAVAATLKRAG
jgi:hypothetical protein